VRPPRQPWRRALVRPPAPDDVPGDAEGERERQDDDRPAARAHLESGTCRNSTRLSVNSGTATSRRAASNPMSAGPLKPLVSVVDAESSKTFNGGSAQLVYTMRPPASATTPSAPPAPCPITVTSAAPGAQE